MTHSIGAHGGASGDPSKTYHLCIRATLGGTRHGPWIVGGTVTQNAPR